MTIFTDWITDSLPTTAYTIYIITKNLPYIKIGYIGGGGGGIYFLDSPDAIPIFVLKNDVLAWKRYPSNVLATTATNMKNLQELPGLDLFIDLMNNVGVNL
jgi:hypothetical protein